MTRKIIGILLALVLLSATVWGETLYVRPVGGEYDAEDGSDYDNAFDGWGDVSWGGGAGSVGAGDTLYAAGTFDNENINISEDGSDGNRIIIRGDYGGDAGIVTGKTGTYAVRIQGADWLTILNLTVTGNNDRGLGCDANSTNLLIDNVTSSSNNTGFWLWGDDLVIQNSAANSNATHGIYIHDSDDIQVLNCTADSNGTTGNNHDGIFIGSCENFLVQNCTVTNQDGQSSFDASDSSGNACYGSWINCIAKDGEEWGFHSAIEFVGGNTYIWENCSSIGHENNWTPGQHVAGTLTFTNCTSTGATAAVDFILYGTTAVARTLNLINHYAETGGVDYAIAVVDTDNTTVVETNNRWIAEPGNAFGYVNGADAKTPAEWQALGYVTSTYTSYYISDRGKAASFF